MDSKQHNVNIVSRSGFKEEEIELLEIAAHFFLQELNKNRKFDTIRCDIDVVDKVSSSLVHEPICGDMERINYLDNGEDKRYYYCRLADCNNSAETMRTLAHELVHVWQMELGRLKVNSGRWEWLGADYGETPYNGTDADYLLPWEVEADTMDIQLSKKFYRHYFK